MRETPQTDEFYHVYNRGVDKRIIFGAKIDLDRFLQGIIEFNTTAPVQFFRKFIDDQHLQDILVQTKKKVKEEPLVDIVAFCINPNHFHMVLKQRIDGGISLYMKKLLNGYTNYFNHRYRREGALFSGTYKRKHVDTDEYLQRLIAYVNLNYEVHSIHKNDMKYVLSSLDEYVSENLRVCTSFMVEGGRGYEDYARELLLTTINTRKFSKETSQLLIE